ncbi:MBL fold metallo-hydrolase [Arthrobacter sp. TES]|uniref:MBL fold metallo-hydrolase RNA specificity domain-containing protein n=1 Tax=Paenarthrobacter ureafaciens TaxID=37931 RepID=UPI000397AE2B|nr:MBL fold metallo-hydrolase [Paenarthrobacter ureafaciens]AOY71601.1 beta-Casp domain-containing protein [Arthrobacter sp. ZXY-2]ERI37876.1 mRNA 3'-end processing factor [Arthrobacter sp. AK-YN10]QOI63434.1 MBL fold metallo-hydrolase [Arthrobacter sp. TES]GLU60132.1 MBL fold hydrolase [Paenarthrobacter ureafaciens]GLU64452.1 MBL fold hydrolase [Paenarthrobacter ureafaciens]
MKNSDVASLRFLGATDTVTGSRYLLDHQGTRVLVDCGLFQGYKRLRERNRRPFPVSPSSIDAVLLPHAHLDHTGYLPLLVRDGFRGPVYSTQGTSQLSKLLLTDSGHLQEEEARHAAHAGSSQHDPVLPLYTALDATRSLQSFRPVDFDTPLQIGTGFEAVFVPAGHILGAAQIRLQAGNASVHFTGDLGRADDPFMYPPRDLEAVDVLVTESTYGNRQHPPGDAESELGDVVRRTVKRGGVVLIAAFAVGRAETLLLQLARLRRKGAIPEVPIYLNSPMAIDASYMYQQHPEEHRLKPEEFNAMYQLATMTRTADDSKLLNLRGGPMIIISASGMLTGGRVLHHIEAYGGDPRNTVVLSGYQAGGTRGATLAAGTRDLRIYGRDVHIRAEVVQLEGYSAHADADAIIRWMRTAPKAPRMTYITHGEPEASDALRLRIKHELGWKARVPEYLETISLNDPD